jgi:protein-disulfide isomerase
VHKDAIFAANMSMFAASSTFSITTLSLVAFLVSGRAGCQSNSSGPEATKEPSVEVKLEGVDTSSLTPRERKEWSSYVSKLPPPCQGAGANVAQCITEKKSCTACLPAAKFLVKAVREGATDELAEKSYRNRFDPAKLKDVKLDDSPSKGPENAAITFIEFADFECPHCGYMAPVIKKAYQERAANMRVIFKFLPLPSHPNGETAARAGIAAIKQGKFWDMHDKLFANQGKNSKQDVEAYAKELGLDMAKFRLDFESAETKDRIERDKKLSDTLDVHGTPTIFVNGRLYESGANAEQSLNDWLNTELVMKGLEPPKPGLAAPTATATALLPVATATASATATSTASAKVAPTATATARPNKP